MTLFEYLSVAVSIVLSLSAAQILSNLRAVLQPDKRYWVHISWIVVALYTHVIIWWEFWAFREVASWTLATFVLVLINPGLLFVASNALVVSDSDVRRIWEKHYFAVRRSFFLPLGMLLIVSVLRDWIILDAPVVFPRLLPEITLTLICGVGWASESKRIHAALALASMLLIVASTAYLWFQPGGGSRL